MDEMLRLLTFRDQLPAHLNWQAVSFIRVAWPWVDSASLCAPNDRAMRPVYFALVSGDRLISHAAVVEGSACQGRKPTIQGLTNT